MFTAEGKRGILTDAGQLAANQTELGVSPSFPSLHTWAGCGLHPQGLSGVGILEEEVKGQTPGSGQ